MRSSFVASVLSIFVLCLSGAAVQPARAADTVVFVVRHCEKAAVPADDPPLSPAGAKRAEQLMQMLEHLNVNAIYHTPFVRTRNTAKPLAEKMHITPNEYDDVSQTWINSVLAAQQGKRTLIVGHSDTVSDIVTKLTGQTIPAIGEHFDNLFVVVISDGNKSVVRLKYGQAN